MNFKTPFFSVFFALILILLAVSLVVHVSLYAGFNTRDHFPFVWRSLQYAVAIGFIPKVVNALSERLRTIKTPPYVWGSARYEEQASWQIYGGLVFGVATVFFCLYAILNYTYWSVEVLNQGNPYIADGQYFIHYYKGGITRLLTADKYQVLSMYYARATSSHWIACHLVALALLHGDWKAAPNKRD